ncbi:4-hydroxybenzoate octaprenyltransferase [Stenoxybacter acetivorans]|uniref:4-hydroxybenzoate octaprenyltransferase n=1 Tax=Stenoxybacter acetivorans TaxID=422441 RepID=UPI00068AFF34|nr:4-hydroxybenzoate octaprenyltransferase [Stenoxybacter acetivorans]
MLSSLFNTIKSRLKNDFLSDRFHTYIQLMRADKPIGTLLLLWPTLWALWIAADGSPTWQLVLLFVLGTFFMRSAGCVVNDFADRDFDGAVARTQNRPFAQKKVSTKEAFVLVAVLCFFALLCLLPMNQFTWLMSLPALFLAFSYPFTKRFFPLPQLYLGLAYSFGIPMAFAAETGSVPALAWLIFCANVLWTLAYDTIYAMADKEDDLKIGIKTSAITFGKYDAEIVMLCHAGFTLLMLILGWQMKAACPYWLAAAVVIYWQYRQYPAIAGRNRMACFHTFLRNNRIGAVWFIGIVLHFWWT